VAIGQLAHLIVGEPEMRSVWIALGLFFTLWWTWVGFAVLYNRHGADAPLQRLLSLAGSVPAGVAAVAIEPAADGDTGVFAASLALTRRVRAAISNVHDDSPPRVTRACLVCSPSASGSS
jgi:low temperature requirement protein LtrA